MSSNKDLIVNAPLNNLSFGNVSINLLREMWKKGMNICLFPIGNPDITAFDKLDPQFTSWLNDSINSRFEGLSREVPTFKLWHLNGCENRISEKQFLFTFHEMDHITSIERSLVNLQNHTFLSSNFSKELFEKNSCKNVSNIKIGFDPDFFAKDKSYFPDVKVFGISGKYEKRKHTAKIIKLWIDKYGGNMDYRLHCLVNNPFLKPEEMNFEMKELIGDKNIDNVTFYVHQKTNSLMNNWLNSVDIDLSGLSGAEGWNLGSFNSTCLGKWSIVLNHTSHKDWATDDNCILVEPSGTETAVDNRFFEQNGPFNQGNINTFDDDEVVAAFEKAESLAKTPNQKGLDLGKDMTYSKTLESIMEEINT